MTLTQDRVERLPVSVSLYPRDIEIVKAADTGQAGFSASLRRIIREWEQRRNALVDARVGYHDVEQFYPENEPA